MRVNVTLACTECGDRNYITTKNKRNNPERIEMKNIVHVITNKLYIVKLNNIKVKRLEQNCSNLFTLVAHSTINNPKYIINNYIYFI